MLTDKSVRALPLPAKGQRTHWDTVIKGLGVRVSKGGAKTFVLMHGKSRKLTTIGRVGIITLANARQKAKQILAARTLGLTRELNEAISLPDALQAFLRAYALKNKESTYLETKRLLERHLGLKKGVSELTTGDITRLWTA